MEWCVDIIGQGKAQVETRFAVAICDRTFSDAIRFSSVTAQ